MHPKFDWLNDQINLMVTGVVLSSDGDTSDGDYEPGEEDIIMLQTAIQLNSLRTGVGKPDAQFIKELRDRLEVVCAGVE